MAPCIIALCELSKQLRQQEVIDVAAVVNALRVALPPRTLTDYEG